nr:NADH dehydrogenase subunit 5 [Glypthelmins sp. LW2G]
MGLSVFFILLGLFIFWSCVWTGWAGSFFLLGYQWVELPVWFMLDSVSLVCVYMLVCCGSIALFYCYHYFLSDTSGAFLFYLICCFLLVMFLLMLSNSVIFSLVMWEYLGLVSFFLILFYSNMLSLRASLVTLFASRFGDVSLFILVSWMMQGWELSFTVCLLLFFLVILTKSACYPFISWLIEAMRAPTPVSSLVHSSTLVAAGVWFMLRYEYFLSPSFFSFLLGISLVTIFISGLCASGFVDLKKIVALSTCNNISWCLLFYICGDVWLALLQLLSHGICKCYLFMVVGDVMSGSLGGQDSKFVYLFRYGNLFGPLLQFVLIFSLCGLPFIGVFFGKHGLLSLIFYSYGGIFLIVLLLCFLLSYIYSFRFYLLLLGDLVGTSFGYLSNFCLIFNLVLLSTLLNYVGCMGSLETVSLGVADSAIVLFIQLFGCFLGFVLWGYTPMLGFSFWCSSLGCSDYFINIFYRYFSWVSSFFVLCLYRWELVLVSGLRGFIRSGLFILGGGSFFSLNFMISAVLGLVIFSSL